MDSRDQGHRSDCDHAVRRESELAHEITVEARSVLAGVLEHPAVLPAHENRVTARGMTDGIVHSNVATSGRADHELANLISFRIIRARRAERKRTIGGPHA